MTAALRRSGTVSTKAGRASGLLCLAFAAAFLAPGAALADDPQPPCSPLPILLLHGHYYTNASLSVLTERLRSDGYPGARVVTLDVSRNTCTHDWAEALSAKVDDVLQESGCSRVDIVAHSRGGLAARDYIRFLGGGAKVSHLVTLGTPHHGAAINMACPGCGCLEMRPGSDYLRRLNAGDETPGPTPYTSIYSSHDEVVPAASAWLSGARNIRLRGVKHTDLLRSRHVYREIRAGLM
ncbi:MAG: alpha/beta fold hydrolase [Deltaproteobacteria bacterium]|nr:alpha/beta fold hydrolase [Deltaproteobacteria bacterium]